VLFTADAHRDEIEQLVFRNLIAFFGQSNRWTFKR